MAAPCGVARTTRCLYFVTRPASVGTKGVVQVHDGHAHAFSTLLKVSLLRCTSAEKARDRAPVALNRTHEGAKS